MDCRTGAIYRDLSVAAFEQYQPNTGRKLLPLTAETFNALTDKGPTRRKNYMRNQPCVCGSGRKFKRCCWAEYS
jgi:uncharacterized protein YecA (UPF0149 family)